MDKNNVAGRTEKTPLLNIDIKVKKCVYCSCKLVYSNRACSADFRTFDKV